MEQTQQDPATAVARELLDAAAPFPARSALRGALRVLALPVSLTRGVSVAHLGALSGLARCPRLCAALSLHHSLDLSGAYAALTPSLPVAVLLSLLSRCLPKGTPPVVPLVDSLPAMYACLEHLFSSGVPGACLLTSVRHATTLYSLSPNSPPTSSTLASVPDLHRLVILLKVKSSFFNSLQSSDLPPSRKLNLTNFVYALVNSPFLTRLQLPHSLLSSHHSCDTPTALFCAPLPSQSTHILHLPTPPLSSGFPLRVTVRHFPLNQSFASKSIRFHSAVFHLRTLHHPSLAAFYAVHWPFSWDHTSSSPSSSQHDSALSSCYLFSEHLPTNLMHASSLEALQSPPVRLHLLANILSALVFLHQARVCHGALCPRNVLLRIHQAQLLDVKLDIPPLIQDVIGFNTMALCPLDVMIFRPPEAVVQHVQPHLTWDVWSFAILACLLLSDRTPHTFFVSDVEAAEWAKEGPLRMAERLLKSVPDPKLVAILEPCLREAPEQRCTASEINDKFLPLAQERGAFSFNVARPLDIVQVNQSDVDIFSAQHQSSTTDGKEPLQGEHVPASSKHTVPIPISGNAKSVPQEAPEEDSFSLPNSYGKYNSDNTSSDKNSIMQDSDYEDSDSSDYVPDEEVPSLPSDNSFERGLQGVAKRGIKEAAIKLRSALKRKIGSLKPEDKPLARDVGASSSTHPVAQSANAPPLKNCYGLPQKVSMVDVRKAQMPTVDPSSLIGGRVDDNHIRKPHFSARRPSAQKAKHTTKVEPGAISGLGSQQGTHPKPPPCSHNLQGHASQNGRVWNGRTRSRSGQKRMRYDALSNVEDDDIKEEPSQAPVPKKNGEITEIIDAQMLKVRWSNGGTYDDQHVLNIPPRNEHEKQKAEATQIAHYDVAKKCVTEGNASTSMFETPCNSATKKSSKRRRSSSFGFKDADVSPRFRYNPNPASPRLPPQVSNVTDAPPSLSSQESRGWSELQLGLRFSRGEGVTQNHSASVRHFSNAVKQGNLKARVHLARCFEFGLGMPRNLRQAVNLYISAAEDNEPDGFYDAARCCDQGIEMDVDYTRALRYYCLAGRKGHIGALMRAAQMYEEGLGTNVDLAETFQIYQMAARHSHMEAKVQLASRYAKGIGVKRNIQRAVELYKEAAKAENAVAMLSLGLLYEDGQGVRKNVEQALKLYQKAAGKGYGPGLTALGQCYLWGFGVDVCYDSARKWFEQGASKGHELAFHELGMLYKEGYGVKQDFNKALSYFRTASAMKCEVSTLQVGECLYHGYGTQVNYQEAFKCFEKAAALGAQEAMRWLGDCYADGSGVEKDLGKAIANYKKAVDLGSASAMTSLASCLENGVGVPVNMPRAYALYKKAAALGDATAENNLGILFENGKHVKKDFRRAVSHYRKAISYGSADAMCNLADCYANGNGVEKDMSEAVKWYRDGANLGHDSSKCELGICYMDGKGVEKDAEKAVQLFRAAAGKESEANRQLGRAYLYGVGVQKDEKQAFKFFEEAARSGGNKDAWYELGDCYQRGLGVMTDKEEAVNSMSKAAEEGHRIAKASLGNLLFELGRYEDAVKWFSEYHDGASISMKEEIAEGKL